MSYVYIVNIALSVLLQVSFSIQITESNMAEGVSNECFMEFLTLDVEEVQQ